MAIGTLILAAFSINFTGAQDATPVPTETVTAVEEVVAEVAAEPSEVDSSIAAVQVSVDSAFVFLTAALVFFMQAGFAFLEAGMIRKTGVINSMMENFMDAAFGGIAFFVVGFGLDYKQLYRNLQYVAVLKP